LANTETETARVSLPLEKERSSLSVTIPQQVVERYLLLARLILSRNSSNESIRRNGLISIKKLLYVKKSTIKVKSEIQLKRKKRYECEELDID